MTKKHSEHVTMSTSTAAVSHEDHIHFPDRFPTREELRIQQVAAGMAFSDFDSELIRMRLERHLRQLDLEFPDLDLSLEELAPTLRADALAKSRAAIRLNQDRLIRITISPWIFRLLRALARPRVDHRALGTEARNKLNQALQASHADGSYQAMAAIHAQNHRMHSMMGPIGKQRFLPWHRIYLFELENLLRLKVPGVTVPYWNYSNDSSRPDWVWKPAGVTRNTPGTAGGGLPTQQVVDNLINNVSAYTAFTEGVEFDAHNQVHNWCNGTISSPSTASEDPIFWLLHANVDRIWDAWQQHHNGTPSLSGSDATMDPWPRTATEADDVIQLGYIYQA